MKLATWNVNSVRARLNRLTSWLRDQQPDIVCLQETKVVDDLFPHEPIEDEGYNIVRFGQKNYNGVAILSRLPVEDVIKGFPNDGDDSEKRVLGCIVDDFMVLNVYVPNGKEVGHEAYHKKLTWLGKLRDLLDERYSTDEKVALVGDFNITFDDRDVPDPDAYREKIHCSTPEREALTNILDFGLTDAMRRFHEEPGIYTWWDFRTRGFERSLGLRIDHILLSDPALETCKDVLVDTDARGGKGPSDHAPVIALFD